jgi:hypothetical protein
MKNSRTTEVVFGLSCPLLAPLALHRLLSII